MVTLIKNPEWHLVEGDTVLPVGLTLGEDHPLRGLVVAAWRAYDEACTDPDRHCDEGSERIAITFARFEALAEAAFAVASWITGEAGRTMRLTTRQLVTRLLDGHFICPEGNAFIDAHPDPLEAIDYALAHAVDPSTFTSDFDFAEFYAAEPDKRGETGAFLRYLASEDVLLGVEGRYGDWRAPGHLQMCADALREWVVKVQAEHAAEGQS